MYAMHTHIYAHMHSYTSTYTNTHTYIITYGAFEIIYCVLEFFYEEEICLVTSTATYEMR